jgi:putative ABC transport system permease protein
MNIFNTFKRSRFFLWINITGLAVGLAASMLLVLFVVNEWSYDKHFVNRERILRLLTASERDGHRNYAAINLRSAAKELPGKVPGVEEAVQAYYLGEIELTTTENRFPGLKGMLVDAAFFRVFRTKFLEGTPDGCLSTPNAVVLTRARAEAMFGSAAEAMGKTVSLDGRDFAVAAVVEGFPKNSHLMFDVVAPIAAISMLERVEGLEFLTYYLVSEGASVGDTRAAIEEAYTQLLEPWSRRVGMKAWGETERLEEVYLQSKAGETWRTKGGSMQFIWVLSGLALFVLLLAVMNFINLFITQGQLRMNEIAIRKAGGAQIGDIIRQFFSEVAAIVLVAFVFGFLLAVAWAPSLAELIGKEIDLIQLVNPMFIAAVLLLFGATVVLSAAYPAFYLSGFSPLEILGRRMRFSRRRLTATVVVFQSVVSLVLLTVIVVLFKQTAYLEGLPVGYNPEDLMLVESNGATAKNYAALRQELLKHPEVKAVAASQHVFGGGWSGQTIANWDEQDRPMPINEYRIATGMPALMELELVEGRFWTESDPDSVVMLLFNEAAVKALGGESPLEKRYKYYSGPARVVGVVKDFYYDAPARTVQPMALRRLAYPSVINIRFEAGVGRIRAQETVLAVLQEFDPEFILNPVWSADVYAAKFKDIRTMTQLVLAGSLIAIFVAMLGLLAIHLFTSLRRMKETSIRRIYGGGQFSIFVLLSVDVLKWIGCAAVVAVPVSVYAVGRALENFANHVSVDWVVVVLPVVAQCVIALLTTSGVTLNVLSRNPAETIQSE